MDSHSIELIQTFIKDSLNNFIKGNLQGKFNVKLSKEEMKGAREMTNFLNAQLDEVKKMIKE